MSEFKFALGAAVVLVTSAPMVIDQLRNDKEDERLAAERKSKGEGGDDEIGLSVGSFAFGIVEGGDVIGRAEFITAEPNYLIRYRDGSGRQVEEWHAESGVTTWEACEQEFAAELAAEAQGGAGDAERDEGARGFDEDREQ